MRLSQLKELVGSHDVPHYNIWFGEDQKILDIYIDLVSKDYQLIYLDSVNEAYNRVIKRTLDKKPEMYVVTDDTAYRTAEDKWGLVEKTFNASSDILIVRYNKFDKKLKIYTRNKEACTEFENLSKDVCVKHILEMVKGLDLNNAEDLASRCGYDYGLILSETHKITCVRRCNKDKDVDTIYSDMCRTGAIYSQIDDITFEVSNSILYGAPERAHKMIDLAKQKSEPPLLIISLLYNGFRNMLAVQGAGKNGENLVERTGLSMGQIGAAKRNLGAYNIKELERNMLICQKAESDLKTGRLDEDIALDYVLLKCML